MPAAAPRSPLVRLVGPVSRRRRWREAVRGLDCRVDERDRGPVADDGGETAAILVVEGDPEAVARARAEVAEAVPMPFIVAVGAGGSPGGELLERGADAAVAATDPPRLLRAQVEAALRRARRQRRFLRYAEDLAEQAHHDPLTGLANRARIDEVLARELARARRHARPLSIAIGDIDHFKAVNDLHGHAVGDEVLRRVAGVLRAGARAGELVGRWGGEEFLWLLPETGLDAARSACERARRAVAGLAIETVGAVSISFGVATLRRHEDAADLVERADAALYRAKRQGRDRVATDEAARADAPPVHRSVARYVRAALRSDEDEVLRIAGDRLAADGPAGLYGGLVEPALDEVGRAWERGRLPVAAEHLVTALTEMAVQRVAAPRPSGEAPLAVVGAAPRNAHRLGVVVAADLLARCGWRTVVLGEMTPVEGMAGIVRALGASLAGLSAASDADLDGLGDDLALLAELLPDVEIAVGGPAMRRHPDWRPPQGVHRVTTAADVLALAGELWRPSGRPRAGQGAAAET